MTREEAYDQIAKLAAEHALILQAFGGVITVVHPETQRREGIEERCLYMAGQGPYPSATAEAKLPHGPKECEAAQISLI